MSLLSGPSVSKPKVSDALRKRGEEKRETVGWSPRRKCPFNQTSAKIPLPSPTREGGEHIYRWTEENMKCIPKYAAFQASRSEGSSNDAVQTKGAEICRNAVNYSEIQLSNLLQYIYAAWTEYRPHL